MIVQLKTFPNLEPGVGSIIQLRFLFVSDTLELQVLANRWQFLAVLPDENWQLITQSVQFFQSP